MIPTRCFFHRVTLLFLPFIAQPIAAQSRSRPPAPSRPAPPALCLTGEGNWLSYLEKVRDAHRQERDGLFTAQESEKEASISRQAEEKRQLQERLEAESRAAPWNAGTDQGLSRRQKEAQQGVRSEKRAQRERELRILAERQSAEFKALVQEHSRQQRQLRAQQEKELARLDTLRADLKPQPRRSAPPLQPAPKRKGTVIVPSTF